MAIIREIRCIRTRANGTWTIVKVVTDQPGLHGIGSASDFYHSAAVIAAIEDGLAPRLIGRDVSRIEDIWQSTYTSGYWRNGSILNTALGAVDVALWDIKGKEAGMPVYQLLGGPCRPAVQCYAHASGDTLGALEEDVRRYQEEGYGVIRCQLGPYGSDKPGLGIDVDEEKAARLLDPDRAARPRLAAEDRKADGTVVRP